MTISKTIYLWAVGLLHIFEVQKHPRPSSAELQLLSPETVLPPPPSPPCTCGKVLADMGPAPLLEPPDWDSHSVDSRFTEESKVTDLP